MLSLFYSPKEWGTPLQYPPSPTSDSPPPHFKEFADEVGVFTFLAIVVIVTPLIEETIFRLPLRKTDHTIAFLFISLSVLAFNFMALTYAIALTVLFILTGIILYRLKSRKVYKLWKQYYWITFYYIAFLFGVIHLTNYTRGDSLYLWGIIYVLPQLLGGLLLGFTRIRYGFKYAILLHFLNNATALSLAMALDWW